MFFISCLTDKRQPDALPALRHTPRLGEVGLTALNVSWKKDRGDNNLEKIQQELTRRASANRSNMKRNFDLMEGVTMCLLKLEK